MATLEPIEDLEGRLLSEAIECGPSSKAWLKYGDWASQRQKNSFDR